MKAFREYVYHYYTEYGRHELPWRLTADPYAILVSEIMLQQTQVDRVVMKYKEFLNQFPSLSVLAKAPLKEILSCWSGLGYNRRALWLKETARELVETFGGTVPESPEILVKLKGIGYATACAIVTYSYNIPTVYIETNIRTVFIHHFFSERDTVHDREILPLVEEALDMQNPRIWYYALMDYGVSLKKTFPRVSRKSIHYAKQSPFKGSDRQIRGWLLKNLANEDLPVSRCVTDCKKYLSGCGLPVTHDTEKRIENILSGLEREGFITVRNGIIGILS